MVVRQRFESDDGDIGYGVAGVGNKGNLSVGISVGCQLLRVLTILWRLAKLYMG